MPFFVDKKHYSAQRIDLATDTNPETSSAVYTSVAEPAFLEPKVYTINKTLVLEYRQTNVEAMIW